MTHDQAYNYQRFLKTLGPMTKPFDRRKLKKIKPVFDNRRIGVGDKYVCIDPESPSFGKIFVGLPPLKVDGKPWGSLVIANSERNHFKRLTRQ